MRNIYMVSFFKYPTLTKLGESSNPLSRLNHLESIYGNHKDFSILQSPKNEYDFFYHLYLESTKNLTPIFKQKENPIQNLDGNTEFYSINYQNLNLIVNDLYITKTSKTDFDKINWLKFYINNLFKQLYHFIKDENLKTINNNKSGIILLGKVSYLLRHLWITITSANKSVPKPIYDYITHIYYKWQSEANSAGWDIGDHNSWTIKRPLDLYDQIYLNPRKIVGMYNYNGNNWQAQKTAVILGVEKWLEENNILKFW